MYGLYVAKCYRTYSLFLAMTSSLPCLSCIVMGSWSTNVMQTIFLMNKTKLIISFSFNFKSCPERLCEGIVQL